MGFKKMLICETTCRNLQPTFQTFSEFGTSVLIGDAFKFNVFTQIRDEYYKNRKQVGYSHPNRSHLFKLGVVTCLGEQPNNCIW